VFRSRFKPSTSRIQIRSVTATPTDTFFCSYLCEQFSACKYSPPHSSLLHTVPPTLQSMPRVLFLVARSSACSLLIGRSRNSTVSQVKWYLRMDEAYYFRTIAILLLYALVWHPIVQSVNRRTTGWTTGVLFPTGTRDFLFSTASRPTDPMSTG
jgi:hypothetical protein